MYGKRIKNKRQSSKDDFLLNSSISAQNSWRYCFFPRKNFCCFQTLGLGLTDHKPSHSRVTMWGVVLTAEIPLLISEFAGPTNSCRSLGAGFKFSQCFFYHTFPLQGHAHSTYYNLNKLGLYQKMARRPQKRKCRSILQRKHGNYRLQVESEKKGLFENKPFIGISNFQIGPDLVRL